MKKVVIVLTILLMFPAGMIFAYGGGGTFVGEYIDGFSWDTSEIGFSGVRYRGGYGYGVTDAGHRVGGFALGLHDYTENRKLGGFGGIITGQQLRLGFLTGSINLWLGVGGLSSRESEAIYLAYFGEGTFELGIKIFSWLQFSGFAGWQVLGNLFNFEPCNPADPFQPVAGFRVTWGKF
ncbi:MAG: hypothetical protein ACLFSE_04835 [Spirochaetia bacterium]